MAYNALRKSGMIPAAAPDDRIIALYVRVSTGYQIEKDSLPLQKKELKNYCKHFLHVDESRIEIFEDAGKSGGSTKRPAYERMMKKIRAGLVSLVIVTKIDRISRNLVDFSIMYNDFKYERVQFISLNEQFDTTTAIGEAVLKIILVFAELERKLAAERVIDIMIERALTGQWNGARVPFGWDWDEKANCPKHSEIEAVFGRLMYDMYEETHSSCKVRDYNNVNDIPTKRGGEWTSKTVADFIRNPMNKGDYRYNYRESSRGRKKPSEEVIYVKGVFPPLVPPEQWDRCNAIMDENAEKRHAIGFTHRRKHCHIFSGILVCAECGAFFQSVKRDKTRANGFTPSLYNCGSRYRKRSCKAPGCSDVTLGPFIINYIAAMVRVSGMRSKVRTIEKLEQILLNDSIFSSIAGIETDGLKSTLSLLTGQSAAESATYSPDPLHIPMDSEDRGEIGKLKQDILKYERALSRLKNAFLFDENGMSEKEYLETKKTLETERIAAENRMKDLSDTTFSTNAGEMAFIKSASSFLLANHIQSGEHIVYSDFAACIENEILKEFIDMVLDRIVIQCGKPVEIHFKNGLIHKFLYREAN